MSSGPRCTRDYYGVHLGDLVVVLGWAAALLALVGLLRATGRRDS